MSLKTLISNPGFVGTPKRDVKHSNLSLVACRQQGYWETFT
jgi:hypothetical protein